MHKDLNPSGGEEKKKKLQGLLALIKKLCRLCNILGAHLIRNGFSIGGKLWPQTGSVTAMSLVCCR